MYNFILTSILWGINALILYLFVLINKNRIRRKIRAFVYSGLAYIPYMYIMAFFMTWLDQKMLIGGYQSKQPFPFDSFYHSYLFTFSSMWIFAPMFMIFMYKCGNYPTFTINKVTELVKNALLDAKIYNKDKDYLFLDIRNRNFQIDRALQVKERYDGRVIQTNEARFIEYQLIDSIPNFRYL